jgi:hypothetical protein
MVRFSIRFLQRMVVASPIAVFDDQSVNPVVDYRVKVWAGIM